MNTSEPTHRGVGKATNLLDHLPRTLRGHVVAVLGELLGTFSFIFFAFGGTHVANATSNYNAGTAINTTTTSKNPDQLLYIALSFGFSLAVNAWVFARISGGLFNPAVTFGMFLIRKITFVRMVLLGVTQCAGAIAAAFVVKVLFAGTLQLDTTPSATTSKAQAVIIEMLLTAQLVFTIFMLAAEKHTGNFIAPVGIGLSLFIAELVGVFWTGGSLNPARSLAPAVATYKFHTTQWIYWVGPLAGAILAAIIYAVVRALEYETTDSTGDTEPEAHSPELPVAYDSEKDAATAYAPSTSYQYSIPEAPATSSNAFEFAAPGTAAPHRGTSGVAGEGQYASSSSRYAAGAPVSRGRYEPEMYTTDITGPAHDERMHLASSSAPIAVVEPRKVL